MKKANLSSGVANSIAAFRAWGALFRTSDGVIGLAIFMGSLLLRLPFRADFLVNWDSVNFALATQAFDLAHHQPHPPGYIGYVALGSALNYITGDPIASLTLVSAIAGAAAAVLLYLLGRQFMARPYAAITAVLFTLSPVVWYYSEVPLTYAVEVALGLAILWTGYRARVGGSGRYLLAATVLLILLGAVRQSGAIFLFPLWLYIVWAFPWEMRRKALGVLIIGNLVWLAPLLWMAGGPVDYLRESAKLAGAVVTPVSVLALNLWGLLRNVGFVVGGFLVGINVGLAVIIISCWRGFNPIARLTHQDRIFFLIWAAPALLTYLLIHTGQLGYVLLLLPIGFLWVGTALAFLIEKTESPQRTEERKGWPQLRSLPAGLVAVGVLTNVLAFFFLPGTIYSVASAEGATLVTKLAVSAGGESEGLTKARARQYDLNRNDVHWQELVSFIHRFDPKATAILTVPDGAGSYRQLAYYLPEYSVYGLGKDQRGNFGHLLTARRGENAFTIDGLHVASRVLPLPSRVQRLVIPDAAIYEHLNMPYLPMDKVTLSSGAKVVVVQIPPMTSLYAKTEKAEKKEQNTPEYFLVESEAS